MMMQSKVLLFGQTGGRLLVLTGRKQPHSQHAASLAAGISGAAAKLQTLMVQYCKFVVVSND